jgi:hypothetical protein
MVNKLLPLEFWEAFILLLLFFFLLLLLLLLLLYMDDTLVAMPLWMKKLQRSPTCLGFRGLRFRGLRFRV